VSAPLDDIIRLAQDDQQSLPNLLRRCLTLASELKNDQLKKWANQELDGYQDAFDQVPAYRKVHAVAYGAFAGQFQAWAGKHIIIPAVMEKEHRYRAETVHLIQSVSSLDNLLKTDTTKGVIAAHWPPNMIAYYSEKLWDGWVCHDAWQEIPKNTLVEVLDSVRNVTLRMALDIRSELGTSADDLSQIKPREADKIQSIVINNLGGNVALGDLDASGSTVIIAGDRKALDDALSQAGLSKVDLDSLTGALQTDGATPGNKVAEWVKEKGSKVLVGGIKVGTKIGSEILTAWIKQHCDL